MVGGDAMERGERQRRRRVSQICLATVLGMCSILSAAQGQEHLARSEALAPAAKHRDLARSVVRSVDRHGEGKLLFRNELGARVLEQLIEAWDPGRDVLLRADILDFERYRHGVSDALRNGELGFAFDIFKRVRARQTERIALAFRLLDTGFDFTRDEEMVMGLRHSDWAQNYMALRERWRKSVKNDILELRLSGHRSSEIDEILRVGYAQSRRRIRQFDADVIVNHVLHSYVRAIDRHGAFLSPQARERLRIRTAGAVQGIGVVLRMDGDHAVVARIVRGSPAARSRAINVQDRILAIGEDRERQLTDVVARSFSDIVKRLRGPIGTGVRLRILPAGTRTMPQTITLIRDRIGIEDQKVTSRMIRLERASGARIGVITIPSFHTGARTAMSLRGHGDTGTSDDVRRVIHTLRRQRMDGLVLDLRRNRGGSLDEAVRTAGLFITSGPVVQVRSLSGTIRVRDDPDQGIAWKGALAVLVGPESASAAEIVASAIQDYRRGLVVGQRTFGKGSAQRLVPLDTEDVEGALKLTVSRWFRVTGATIEGRGVYPDINLARTSLSAGHFRADAPGPETATRIGTIQWNRNETGTQVFPPVVTRSRQRIGTSRAFDLLHGRGASRVPTQGAHRVSLNFETRRRQDQRSRQRRERDIRTLHAALSMEGVPMSMIEDKSLDSLANAFNLYEAVRLAGDLARVWTEIRTGQ